MASWAWSSATAYDFIQINIATGGDVGDSMSFAGVVPSDNTEVPFGGHMKQLNPSYWLSTRGGFDRSYHFTSTEDPYISYLIDNGHPTYANGGDYMDNSGIYDTNENKYTWKWDTSLLINREQKKSHYAATNYVTQNVLNYYSSAYKFSQTVNSPDTNLACFRFNVSPDNENADRTEIDHWIADQYTIFSDSDVPESYVLDKKSDQCYFIVCFADPITTTNVQLQSFKTYKMNSNSIEIIRPDIDCKILQIWRV